MTDLPQPSRADSRPADALVRFDAVSKRFGDVPAVDGVTLDIAEGEMFALLGPSGCGKTTLLRMLAGFEQPSGGRILLDGRDVSGVPPHRRPVNMMFQSYALFPHLTVSANVAFGLKQDGLPRAGIAARVEEMLAMVRLSDYGERKPHQLSGGQRQRVALARALAKRPRVLLLDEPLSALDRKLREETRAELTDLQVRLGLTFVIVTHDQDEAMSMAGRIGVMNRGRLVQVGPPAEVYERPATRWVAGFIGDMNTIEGRVAATASDFTEIKGEAGGRYRVAQAADVPIGTTVWVAVRPEKVEIARDATGDAANAAAGAIVDVSYLGDVSVCKVRLDNGIEMKASVANRSRHAGHFSRGDRVRLSFAPEAAMVLTQ
jgi:putrescine transport system ATP-binding protein